MPLTFTDRHATSLVAPSLAAGEEILFRCRGIEKPWYSQIFWRLGAFFWKNWLVVGTTQRLLFVQYGGLLGGYAAKGTHAFGWHELDEVKLGWGVFNKTLRARSARKGLSRSVVLGRFWMKGNFAAAEGMTRQWESSRRALSTTPTGHAALLA